MTCSALSRSSPAARRRPAPGPSRAARRRRRPRAPSTPTSRRASSAPKRSPMTITLRSTVKPAPATPASCGLRARITSCRTATCCTSASRTERDRSHDRAAISRIWSKARSRPSDRVRSRAKRSSPTRRNTTRSRCTSTRRPRSAALLGGSRRLRLASLLLHVPHDLRRIHHEQQRRSAPRASRR